MLPLIIPVTALLMGAALLLMGTGLLNTLLALRGVQEGFSDGSMGLIMSGYFVGFFIGTFLALPLISRMGHIRAFAFCAALVACSVLLHELFINPWGWGLSRVLTGTALVILYTIIESWLNAQTPPEQRGRIFAVYMVVNLAALALAQQFLQFGEISGFGFFAVASILVTLSLLPVTWTRVSQPEVQDVQRLPLKKLFNIAPVALYGALLSGLAMGAFWGMSALYAGRIGLDTQGVAMFMTCGILGGVLLQYPLGRYSDTHDRRLVLAVVACASVMAAALLAVLSSVGNWVMLAIAIYGGLAFAVYPLAVAHLVDHLEHKDILAGGSALLLVHGLGAAVGPAVSGWLMTMTGPQALPAYFAATLGTLAMVAVQYLHKEKTESPESPAPFVPMVRTTPTVLEMLPEEDGENISTSANEDSVEEQYRESSG